MEIFTTSHRKEVLDGIGGKAKSLVQVKVMIKGNDTIIVQPPDDFSKAAEQLLNKTVVILFTQKEISQKCQKLLTGA